MFSFKPQTFCQNSSLNFDVYSHYAAAVHPKGDVLKTKKAHNLPILVKYVFIFCQNECVRTKLKVIFSLTYPESDVPHHSTHSKAQQIHYVKFVYCSVPKCSITSHVILTSWDIFHLFKMLSAVRNETPTSLLATLNVMSPRFSLIARASAQQQQQMSAWATS